jgi:hypothetical protein
VVPTPIRPLGTIVPKNTKSPEIRGLCSTRQERFELPTFGSVGRPGRCRPLRLDGFPLRNRRFCGFAASGFAAVFGPYLGFFLTRTPANSDQSRGAIAGCKRQSL